MKKSWIKYIGVIFLTGLFVLGINNDVYAADNYDRNGTKYDSLQAAINAANFGDTITLLTDVTEKLNHTPDSSNAAIYISGNKNITLNLNGHNLYFEEVGTSGDTGCCIKVGSDSGPDVSVFTLTGKGVIAPKSDNDKLACIYLNPNSTFKMEGGSIKGFHSVSSYSAVYVGSSCTFNMTGGSITDNTCDYSTAAGGGAVDNRGTMNIQGNAVVKGNSAKFQGIDYDSTNIYLNGTSGFILSDNFTGEVGIRYFDAPTNSVYIQTNGHSGIENIFLDNDPTKYPQLDSTGKIIGGIPRPKKKAEPTQEVLIDRDTFKSSVASGTITLGSISSGFFLDMKAHEMSEITVGNQDFLANLHPAAKGKKIKIISRFDIYPRRDLSTTEKGSLNTLTWNDLKNTTPGLIYAVCYSQNCGAYYLTGTIDAKGSATFPNFIVNEATSITVFQVQ